MRQRQVHAEHACHHRVNGQSEGPRGEEQLELDQLVSFEIQLDVNKVCVVTQDQYEQNGRNETDASMDQNYAVRQRTREKEVGMARRSTRYLPCRPHARRARREG